MSMLWPLTALSGDHKHNFDLASIQMNLPLAGKMGHWSRRRLLHKDIKSSINDVLILIISFSCVRVSAYDNGLDLSGHFFSYDAYTEFFH